MAIKNQTSSITKKALKNIAKSIKHLNKDIAVNKWKIAEYMYELFNEIPWKFTGYKSLSSFLKDEVGVTYEHGYVYANAYEHVLRLKYTSKQLETLSKHFSFTPLLHILKSLSHKVPVKLIIKHHKVSMSATVVINEKGEKTYALGNVFRMILSDKHSQQLIDLLVPFGLEIGRNRSKQNLSKAMRGYLNSI